MAKDAQDTAICLPQSYRKSCRGDFQPSPTPVMFSIKSNMVFLYQVFTSMQELSHGMENSWRFLLVHSTRDLRCRIYSLMYPQGAWQLTASLQKASKIKQRRKCWCEIQPESSTGCFEAISQNMWKRVGFAIVPSLLFF